MEYQVILIVLAITLLGFPWEYLRDSRERTMCIAAGVPVVAVAIFFMLAVNPNFGGVLEWVFIISWATLLGSGLSFLVGLWSTPLYKEYTINRYSVARLVMFAVTIVGLVAAVAV